jgi:hypothetical protein
LRHEITPLSIKNNLCQRATKYKKFDEAFLPEELMKAKIFPRKAGWELAGLDSAKLSIIVDKKPGFNLHYPAFNKGDCRVRAKSFNHCR